MTDDEDADHLDLRHRCNSFEFMMHADHFGPTHPHQLRASFYGRSFAAETVQDRHPYTSVELVTHEMPLST
jgi:hypothetical protein